MRIGEIIHKSQKILGGKQNLFITEESNKKFETDLWNYNIEIAIKQGVNLCVSTQKFVKELCYRIKAQENNNSVVTVQTGKVKTGFLIDWQNKNIKIIQEGNFIKKLLGLKMSYADLLRELHCMANERTLLSVQNDGELHKWILPKGNDFYGLLIQKTPTTASIISIDVLNGVN